MKRTILVFMAVMASLVAFAQTEPGNRVAVSAGFELGIPTQSIFNAGIGGSVKAEIPVASPISLSLTAGYSRFGYKNAFIGASNKPAAATFVPLKAGVRYFISSGFYGEGEAGTVIETNYEKDKLFTFSIGPGFIVPLKSGGIDFGFRYERWSNQLRQTGLRVAYRFAW